MPKFRKKPVIIEAIQYTSASDLQDAIEFTNGKLVFHGFNEDMQPCARYTTLAIETLEGWMKVSLNDWIIKGVKGEFYPCKPDIFEATYEPVE